jgi:hypothetical protein
LNKSQIQNITNSNGQTELAMYSPFGTGATSNIAVGSINPSNSNLNTVSGIWASLGFGSNPPYSSDILQIVIWFFSSPFGRAMGEIIFFIGAVLALDLTLRDRRKAANNAVTVATYKNTKQINERMREK